MTHNHFGKSATFADGGTTSGRRRYHIAMLVLACCSTPAAARAEDPPNPAASHAASDEQQKLQAEQNELIRSANGAYQAGQYEEAMRRLEQLVALYAKIYPAAEFPQGHIDIMQCLSDMCQIAYAAR